MNINRFTSFEPASLCLILAWSLVPCDALVAANIDPVLVGYAGMGGEARDVAVSGNYAYVAATDGLQVIDISNPANPRWVAEQTGLAGSIVLAGHYAYVWWGGGDKLQIIDISNPASPQRIGRYDGVTPGCGSCFAVSGNYAYMAVFRGLEVIDISKPAAPSRVGSHDALGYAGPLAVSGHYAYLGVSQGGGSELEVIDVANPSNPQRVGSCKMDGGAIYNVTISKNHAFIMGFWFNGTKFIEGLHVIDVSNPANPQHVAEIAMSVYGGGVTVAGNYAYVSNGAVIDISNPTIPKPAGGFSGTDSRLAVSGNYAYAAGRGPRSSNGEGDLLIFDLSTPASPQQVGESVTSGHALGVAASGNFAYVAIAQAGIKVIDTSDPPNAHAIGRYDTGGNARDVAVSGSFAYVANGEAGLQVIDISNPANPQRAGGYDTSGDAVGVAVAGQFAYVADRPEQGSTNLVGGGLNVIDISNPDDPKRMGGYEVGGYASQVAVAGNYAYLASTRLEMDTEAILGGDLHVIDVSAPDNPQRVGGYRTMGAAEGLAVSGHYVYLASRDDGLQVIDISDPSNPERVGAYDPSGYVWYGRDVSGHVTKVTVSGNYAYVIGIYYRGDLDIIGCGASPCAPKRFLAVLDISNPASPRQIGGYDDITTNVASGIALAQGKILVVGAEQGLSIYELPPFFKTTSRSNGQIHLSWEGAGTRLQTTPRLTNPDWQDVPGSENIHTLSLPLSFGAGFFRLIKP